MKSTLLGTQPMVALAPLDYRYALDAAMSLLARTTAPIVLCNVPALEGETRQRIPHWAEMHNAGAAALWVEPLVHTWQSELAVLAKALPANAPLVIVASRPLARMLPERRAWDVQALGMQLRGIGCLHHAFRQMGFVLQANYGIHSVVAIGLNMLSQQVERWGRPDTGDRLHFAARLRYHTTGPSAAFSTVALLCARKRPVC